MAEVRPLFKYLPDIFAFPRFPEKVIRISLPRVTFVKLFLQIIIGISILLSGSNLTFGFSLFNGSKPNSVNRWPYSFGDRYIYDNTGSRWNYDSGNRSNHSNLHQKYWRPRFEYDYKVEVHTDEEFQDLIEHLSKDNIHHNRPSHYDPICR